MQVKASHNRKVMYASLLVWVALLSATHTSGQVKVNIDIRNWSLKKSVDSLIKIIKVSDTNIYAAPGVFDGVKPVNVNLKGVSIYQALTKFLEHQDLVLDSSASTYFINKKRGTASKRRTPTQVVVRAPVSRKLRILVINEAGESLPEASVKSRLTEFTYMTGRDGVCLLQLSVEDSLLQVSFAGMKSADIVVRENDSDVTATLEKNVDSLDETIVKSYFDSDKRTSTGNISTVTSDLIRKQSVNDPLLALQGHVTGLTVTQTSGVPGAQEQVLIRGQGSIANGNSPLFVVDGVPYIALLNISNIPSGNAAGSLSPFSSINPGDIERMDVLKDADATAIYGSRGANGVILITTYKADSAKARFGVRVLSGVSRATRTLRVLNTAQYVRMRREALTYDGLTPDVYNAPDLISWDTTQSTDWPKALPGGYSHNTTVELSISGGNERTIYQAGGSFSRETGVFPDHAPHTRGTGRINVQHASSDRKLTLQISGLIGLDRNKQGIVDLSRSQFFDPNGPSGKQAVNATGEPLFWANGVYYNNPLSFIRQFYQALTSNLLTNALVNFRPVKGVNIKTCFGFNWLNLQEDSGIPISSQDASSNPTGSSYAANTKLSSWTIEQEAEYKRRIGRFRISVLTGFTMQGQRNVSSTLTATGFMSDATLSQPATAASLYADKEIADYHYIAVYGRINLNWDDRYVLNLTGRRDGSSRFGPGRQFGNFGAVGAAWIFKKSSDSGMRWWNFGKLRGSVGVTGNDQIGDYQYVQTWSTVSGNPYQGIRGFAPTRPANTELGWETIGKIEVGGEFGFFDDRISFSSVYYRHRSSNQLLPYLLPLQTGFNVTLRNSPGVVTNTGYEFNIQSINVRTHDVQWITSFNISFPTNRLVAFPGLASSTYSSSLQIGQSLTPLRALRLIGVDPATGIWQYEDINKDGKISDSDMTFSGNFGLRYYGGFHTSLRVKQIQFDAHFEFRRQRTKNYMIDIYNYNAPGMMAAGQYGNTSIAVEDRWRKAGDRASYQRPTTLSSSEAGKAAANYGLSNAAITDGSFIRCKTLSIAYYLPTPVLTRLHLIEGRVFVQAQNSFLITPYRNVDPEIASAYILPPMATIAAGFQFQLK